MVHSHHHHRSIQSSQNCSLQQSVRLNESYDLGVPPMKNQIDLEIYFYHYDKTKLRSAGGQQANLIVLSTETNCSVLARPGDIF